jgi:iron complex transport system ATP-binding protein
MSVPESILSMQNTDFGYYTKSGKNTLLSGINLEVGKSELIGLAGRNGSGKSTMLRTIVRLQESLNGAILLNGKNIREFNKYEFAKMVAFVSTGVVEQEVMTIRELVSLGRFPYTNWIGSLLPEDHEIIDNCLNMVGITFLADHKICEVSDGERQRAMIARTLAQNTPVIILDEPTAFLDLPAKYDLINLLYDLTRKGKTIIYSSHDLNITMKFSDKLWIIDEDHVYEGSPEDMILNNTISRIFESDKIAFNQGNGDFELKRTSDKAVLLTGDDPIILNWTKQALTRNGFRLTTRESTVPSIEIKKEKDRIIWKLQNEKQNLSCESIYELLSNLNNLSNT